MGPSFFNIWRAQSVTPEYGSLLVAGSIFCAMRRDLIRSNGIEKRAAVNPYLEFKTKIMF